MTNQANLDQLLNIDIDWFGMIFYPDSKRYIGETLLKSDSKTKRVGVFVNASKEHLLEMISLHQLDGLQLHGEESPQLCEYFKQESYLVIKAISVGTAADLQAADKYQGLVDYLLFDTKGPQRGGHGFPFDWQILQAYEGDAPFILAGGIGPKSIDAIKLVDHPKFAGIDLNSRFETSPGVKDISKIKDFKDALYS